MKKVVLSVFILAVMSSLFGYIQLNNALSQPLQVDEPLLYEVKPGTGFNQLCRAWQKNGWLTDCWKYRLLAKLDPALTDLRSGVYRLADTSVIDAIRMINRGEEHSFSFTIIEGERLTQVLDKLADAKYLKNTDIDVKALANEVGETELEGRLFPDTYHYYAYSNAAEIIGRALEKMNETLDELWNTRNASVPLKSPYEALILASIIEKETGKAAERPMIASVFVNRLNRNMRLQTDPTVIYGLGDSFDGDLKRRDLQRYTPYNTYKINGLPPTPIAMPSRASIQAALNPVASDFYYFVGRGDGSHQFSKTLAEHNLAVKKYQLKAHNDS